MSTITKEKTDSKVDIILGQPFKLILENDDVNSFDWVITCLIQICQHEYEQASQCAMIVHNNGKCDVKYGPEDIITKMKDKLRSAGLSVTMEKN